MNEREPCLELRGLEAGYPARGSWLRRGPRHVPVVDRVDLDVRCGETVGLVGESGSGKTTLSRAALRLVEPTAGTIRFRGRDFRALTGRALRRERRHLQMVFQDPWSSLDPRMRIDEALFEPLLVHGLARRSEQPTRVAAMLQEVGLPADAARRYPHEFSGGQRQRIGIARALATHPDLLVADEPVSALDVSVRAQVINLLARLQSERGLALLLVAHDLAIVEQLADRLAVLYLGRIVEEGPAAAVLARPLHPYTAALRSAVPRTRPGQGAASQRLRLAGEPPNPLAPPTGCRFHPRCPVARSICREQDPPWVDNGSDGRVACHFPGTLEAPRQAP